MSSGVDLDLINYIDPTWKTFKKGPRSETRLRKPVGKHINMGIGAEFGSNISKNVQDSSVLESEKLGVAVLGEHFAEKTTAVPIKKRRLSRQSSSPPPRTPSLNGEASLSPEPNTPSPNNDESEQLVHSKSVSGQWSYSDSNSKKRANKKKKNGLGADGTMTRKKKKKKTELTTREFFQCEDFSGIALLVAAACSSSIEENADHVESSGVEELATPEGNDASRVVTKENVTASESEGSSVPENALPVVQDLHCDNENDREVMKSAPSKDVRFHWDLNTVMDEWEEPCFDPPPCAQGTCAEGVVDGDLQFQKGCEKREFNIGCDIESKASDVEITLNKSDSVNLLAPPASTTSTLVGQDYVIGDSKGQDVVQGSTVDNIANEFPKSADLQMAVTGAHIKLVTEAAVQCDLHCQKSGNPLDDVKSASENPPNENGSEVSQDEQRHPADGDTMMKIQEGYDSPYEDGELREPLVHGWEENGVENMENECVDFEFDNQYEDDFESGEHSMLENFVVGREDSQTLLKTKSLAEKQVDAVNGNDMIQLVKDVSSKPSSLLGLKTPEGYQLQEICEDVNLEGNNSKFYYETKSGHGETRTLSGNMLHMDGSSPFDVLHRRGTSYMRRSRFDEVGETYSRPERVLGSEKDRLPFQGRVRNEVDRRWVDSAGGDWDSRNHYGYTRSRNIIGDPDSKPSGQHSRDHSQSRSYGPRDMYRPLNRRQSPVERNDSYPLHRRTQPGRGFTRERSRGRSGGFIPQGFRRGPQEEFHEPGPYYLERKERGFSPSYNRDSHISRPRRRSPSRSRSISPIAWNMNNRGTKRPSPEFRPEGRNQVERFPFPKPTFSGDFDQGLVSPPRGRRLSPQRNSRCFDDQKCMDGQYRERRSSPPARMFRRNPRFDSVEYPERLKSVDFYRPATRPGRFQQMPGAGRGPRNFDESSYDRRKPDGRYDTMNRARRYDIDAGAVKRFRYDGGDDCFEPRNARNEDAGFRGPVRRGGPVSISEERNPPRVYQEKLITADASLPGEHEDDASGVPPVRRAAAVNIREERSPPRIHQEKLIAVDAPLPLEQDFDVNASTKEV